MNINIKSTDLELTPVFKDYIAEKINDLDKLIERLEKKNNIEMFVEVGRLSNHHYKGEVFFAKGDLNMPKKSIIAETTAESPRAAIDLLRDKLYREIEKYRDQRRV